MNKYLLLNLLKQGGYLMLSKILIKELGLDEAAVLAMLLDKNAQHGDDFFVTADTAQETLNLGRRPYDSAISNLKEKGLITTYLKGTPPKTYFIINFDLLCSYFQFVQNGQLNLYGEDNLICTGRTTNNNIDNKKLNNNILIEEKDEEFEKFWSIYDKKVERAHTERMWKKLKAEEKKEILQKVSLYVASTPDKQYRMNPATYINPANKRWQDEIRGGSNPVNNVFC